MDIDTTLLVLDKDQDLDLVHFKDLPIAVKILMWQDSTVGQYIEFKIKCYYQEGQNEKSVDDHSAAWSIYKRYSNFQQLHS